MKHFASLASILCIIHCTVLPILFVFLPTSALYLLLDSKIEFALLTFAFALNIYNVCFGIKNHKNYSVIWFFSAGFVLTLLGYYLHKHQHSHHNDLNFFMVLGSIILIISNFVNNRFCKLCKSCNMDLKNEKKNR